MYQRSYVRLPLAEWHVAHELDQRLTSDKGTRCLTFNCHEKEWHVGRESVSLKGDSLKEDARKRRSALQFGQ